jgi:hypothetical protein
MAAERFEGFPFGHDAVPVPDLDRRIYLSDRCFDLRD